MKTKKKESTKIIISIRSNFKLLMDNNEEIKINSLRCWVNGKRVKNPEVIINYKNKDLKY